MHLGTLVSATIIALIPSVASADFVTLDRFADGTRVGVEASYVARDYRVEDSLLRFDAHGHWVHPRTGAGAYAVAPMRYDERDPRDSFEIGNLELGGLIVRRFRHRLGLVTRLGVGLPTGNIVYVDSHAIAGFSRLGDVAPQLDDGVTPRLSASGLVSRGQLFGRFDLGLDVVLAANNRGVVRMGAGVGVALGYVDIMGEITLVSRFTRARERSPFATAALSVRAHANDHRPYVAVVVPLDTVTKYEIDLAITVGLEWAPGASRGPSGY